MGFEAEAQRDPRYGALVTLRHDGSSGAPPAVARIAPDLGFNLYSLRFGGFEWLHGTLEQVRRTGFGGNPILYPTPNRVRDARFRFEGREFRLAKDGEPRKIHGLVYDEPFEWMLSASGEAAEARGWIDFAGRESLACFPFDSRLSVAYRLTEAALTLSYTVENRSGGRLPFGFAIHPFFALEGDMRVRVPARRVYESDPERFPVRRIDAGGTSFDLGEARSVRSLRLDDVYTDLCGACELICPARGAGLALTVSPDFRHVVVYTPEAQPFFCVENQTCMTDAHNAYDRGDRQQSGLIVLEPGASHSGSIRFSTFGLPA